MHKLVICY